MPVDFSPIERGLSSAGESIDQGLFLRARERKRLEAEQLEKDRRKRVGVFLASTMGLNKPDNPDHDIFQAVQNGEVDWEDAKQAVVQRKAQREEQEKLAQAQQEQQQAAAEAEAQMRARQTEEVNLMASGAMRSVAPEQMGPMATNVADETDPGRQFSMRQSLANQTRQREMEDQGLAAREDAMSRVNPELQGLFRTGQITPNQAGLIPDEQSAGQRGGVTPTQARADAKELAFAEIEQRSYEYAPRPIAGDDPDENEKLRKRWVLDQKIKWMRENARTTGDPLDALKAQLTEEMESLQAELNQLLSE